MKSFSFAIAASLALVLAACGGTPSAWGTPPDQLEALAVTGVEVGAPLSTAGALVVTGAGQDFSLSVDGMTTPMGVHSPGKSDLTTLQGRNVTVEVPVGVAFDGSLRDVVIRDAAGPVYVASYALDTTEMFGAGFTTYGTPVAAVFSELHAGYMEKSYTSIAFKTDEGTVEVMPGEVRAIKVNGATYRAAAIAAVQIDYHVDEELGCGESSALVYELLRVDAPPPPVKLIRPATLPALSLTCGGV